MVRRNGRWQSAGSRTRERLLDADRITARDVTVYSSDIETIATCLRLAGAGDVCYRPPRPNYQSKNGARAFSRLDGWQWILRYKELCQAILAQLRPYLTSKRDLATLALPIRGGSCHPCHLEGPADTVHNTPEQIERNWEEFKKADQVDTRAIRRQHRFKPGHGPHDDNPHEPWATLNLKFDPPHEPDQRHLLSGGPESGVPCPRCDTMTRIAGEMSRWEIMNQFDPEQGIDVRPANVARISEARKKDLQKEMIVVLACPQCYLKLQFDAELLPK